MGTGLAIVLVLLVVLIGMYYYAKSKGMTITELIMGPRCGLPSSISAADRVTTPGYCGIKDWNHVQHPGLGGSGGKDTIADCADLCNKTSGCTGFVYWGDKKSCYLQNWPSAAKMAEAGGGATGMVSMFKTS